jgi:hypothetical protein
MLRERITQNPVIAVTVGSGSIAVVGAGILGVLMLAGVPVIEAAKEPPVAVEPAALTQASWQETPAGVALVQALAGPPDGWGKEGDLQRAVTPPFPYSCPQPGSSPAISLAQTYSVNGVRIQVVTQAHTAGGGAEAMARQLGNVGICSGGDGSATITSASGEVPGVESHLAATNRGNIRAAVLSSRRGDVITHVIGPQGAPVQALALAFDSSLNREIKDKCAAMDSKAGDATRSPWSTAGYKPFTTAEKVSVPAASLPQIPSGVTAAKIDIPGAAHDLPTVEPAPEPTYPVWPAMPAPLQMPQAPAAPPATAPKETQIEVPARDATGPGCGWAFTGMQTPSFDTSAAATVKTTLTLEAMSKLGADGRDWQKAVLDYWISYAQYEKDTKAYQDYATAVTNTNSAWAAIDKKWDTYNGQVATREKQTRAHKDFLDRQKAATVAYEKGVEACEGPMPSPTATAGSSEASEKGAQLTQQRPAVRSGCPVDKPEIINQTAPTIDSEPTPPADPRPKS